MAKRARAAELLPPCYATVLDGLESVAADEITRDASGEVKRTGPGLVVFRVPEIGSSLLDLRTTEDVFLFAWGTDRLTYRATDLESIRRWTAREPDWAQLLRIHHALRPKPAGRPTYHLVSQMVGTHGYRRVDALRALAEGLRGKLPASWKPAEENASIEVWLTIREATAVCGLRLSDRTMRHRTYKREHLPASLRPTLAAAMVRLAGARFGQTVLDPMCGAGTILAEQFGLGRARDQRWGSSLPTLTLPRTGGGNQQTVMGGDVDARALRAAGMNLRRLGSAQLIRWDATRLPLPGESVDRIVSNPPFGKQMGRPKEIGPFYQRVVVEMDRTLRPGGRAVLLVSDLRALRGPARFAGWKLANSLRVRVLGQAAIVTVWEKPRQAPTGGKE